MLRMKEILVPTDLSEESTAAFGLARDLAELTGAKIALVTAVDDPARIRFFALEGHGAPVALRLDELVGEILKQSKKKLDALAKKIGPACAETVVVEGTSPAREVLRVAEERKSDLIVVATHGRSGLAHLALGSTAERIVRGAACPVVTVRVPKK